VCSSLACCHCVGKCSTDLLRRGQLLAFVKAVPLHAGQAATGVGIVLLLLLLLTPPRHVQLGVECTTPSPAVRRKSPHPAAAAGVHHLGS
jgi:hypothetical protein